MKKAPEKYTTEITALSNAEVNFFSHQGYLILPSFLSTEHCARLTRDIDQLLEQRTGGYASRNSDANGTARIISFPDLGALTSHPPMIAKIRSLMVLLFIINMPIVMRKGLLHPIGTTIMSSFHKQIASN